jgi:predicted secreted protein
MGLHYSIPVHLRGVSMDETIISVRAGESFHIFLDSNPSTGYSWEADYEKKDLVLENRTYQVE